MEQMTDFQAAVLGRTGLRVGRLGVSASYGVPTGAVEHAYESGVNYFYWGSRRTEAFRDALRHLAPRRESFVLTIQSYSRAAGLIGWSLERALKELRFDYADVLLLGAWNKEVPARILDASRRLKERGLVKFLAVSTHARKLVPRIAAGNDFDVVHVRYNAAHPGAEQDIFPHLPAQNLPGLVAFTATSWGQLVGKPALVRRARPIPAGEKVPTGTDCYRFVLSRPELNVCMTGPANAAQMDQALEALRLGPMAEEELAWMRRVGRAVSGK
jgi:aryl-alcohol dehydrogenase-like predicted oxidoreductase